MNNLPSPPSTVEYENYKFLIFDAPNEDNLHLYIKVFQQTNIKFIARTCDPTYSTDSLDSVGIQVIDLPFDDGSAPTKSVLVGWLDILNLVGENSKENNDQYDGIGVHCVAGLGRAPVLVAVALLELGLDYLQAITLIRKQRKGAINPTQLDFLKHYSPKSKKKCLIM